MAAVTVKEESEDPDYYQYNIQGILFMHFFFPELFVVKIQIYQLPEFIKYDFIDFLDWHVLIIYHWNKTDFKNRAMS